MTFLGERGGCCDLGGWCSVGDLTLGVPLLVNGVIGDAGTRKAQEIMARRLTPPQL